MQHLPKPAPVPLLPFEPEEERLAPARERVQIERALGRMRPVLAQLDPRMPEYRVLAQEVDVLERRLGQLRVPGIGGLAALGPAYQENIIEPSAAALVAGLQRRVIPGQQVIERRAAELMAQGVQPDTARLQAYKETPMPSVRVPVLPLLPPPGAIAQAVLPERFRPALPLGLKGLAEIAVDPFNLFPAPLGVLPTAKGVAQAGRLGLRAAGALGREIVTTPAVREQAARLAMPLRMAEEVKPVMPRRWVTEFQRLAKAEKLNPEDTRALLEAVKNEDVLALEQLPGMPAKLDDLLVRFTGELEAKAEAQTLTAMRLRPDDKAFILREPPRPAAEVPKPTAPAPVAPKIPTWEVEVAMDITLPGRKAPERGSRLFRVDARTRPQAIKAIKDAGHSGEIIGVRRADIATEVLGQPLAPAKPVAPAPAILGYPEALRGKVSLEEWQRLPPRTKVMLQGGLADVDEVIASFRAKWGTVAPAPAAAKEPWQMTQMEFLQTPEGKPSVRFPINVKHRQAVTQALSEGKAVPPEVLADYPDLAARAVPRAEVLGRRQLIAERDRLEELLRAERAKRPAYPDIPTDTEWRQLSKQLSDINLEIARLPEVPPVAKPPSPVAAKMTRTPQIVESDLAATSEAIRILSKPSKPTEDEMVLVAAALQDVGISESELRGLGTSGIAPDAQINLWIQRLRVDQRALQSELVQAMGGKPSQIPIPAPKPSPLAPEAARAAEPAPPLVAKAAQPSPPLAEPFPGPRPGEAAPPPVEPPIKEMAKAETDSVASLSSGQQVQVPLSTTADDFIRGADPSGTIPPPPKPPAPPGGPPRAGDPDEIFKTIARQATRREQPSETLLRRYGGAMTTAENEARLALDTGNRALKQAGIGQAFRGRLVPRQQDIPALDTLFEALHNPSKVASGEIQVPPALRGVFDDLRRLTDWEEAMRLDFDPVMATVEDYFYRGWLMPKRGALPRGSLGITPAFKKPRVGATYREMREAGFEPISWNPYEQWRISRLQGVRYRQQMELVQALKKMDLAVTDAAGKGIEGWRTPRVGPAFEGKIFATTNDAGEPMAMYSRRWLVPDALANRLEGLYGTPISLGNVTVANRSVNLMKAIDVVTFLPKRLKLFGSFFQQIDFLTRSYIGAWSGMVDALAAGQPVKAVKHLAVWPKSAMQIVEANFRPGARNAVRQQLNSTKPIIAGRPGIHLRGIMEAGLSTVDTTILPANLDSTARVVAEEAGLMGNAAVRRGIGSLESAMRRGLFEGTYPVAQITDIKNNIAPMLVRRYGNMSDEALNGLIARVANKKYSTIPVTQSVMQNRYLREILRRVFFSIGESEGLIRQATGAIRGSEAGFWRAHWIGAYIGLAALANAIHFASTGQPLPLARYLPLSRDRDGPLPLGYNSKFFAPDIPLKGKEGLNVTVDLVGQMDTALRILDPISFFNSRESVPIRAGTTQLSERDYFGRPIDQVGPGGIYSRTTNLINDLFTPIGGGQAAVQIGLEKGIIPKKLLPSSEKGLGVFPQLVQATGINLRAQYLRYEWASDLQPYNDIPSNENERKAKLAASKTPEERLRYKQSRENYRKNNPEVDAKLFVAGDVASLATDKAFWIAVRLMKENRLAITDIRGLEVQEFESSDRTALRKRFERALRVPSAPTAPWAPPPPWAPMAPGRLPTPLAPPPPRLPSGLLDWRQIP